MIIMITILLYTCLFFLYCSFFSSLSLPNQLNRQSTPTASFLFSQIVSSQLESGHQHLLSLSLSDVEDLSILIPNRPSLHPLSSTSHTSPLRQNYKQNNIFFFILNYYYQLLKYFSQFFSSTGLSDTKSIFMPSREKKKLRIFFPYKKNKIWFEATTFF